EQTTLGMEVEVLNDTTLQAYHRNAWWQYDQKLYFRMVTSKPFTYDVVRDTIVLADGKKEPRCKVLLHFPTSQGEQVLVKASYSACDYEGAKKNLSAEMPAWDFEGTRQKARDLWNEKLSKIDIDTDDEEQRTIFYSALYHTHYCPNLFQDVDGRYLGMDLQIHQGDVNDPYYTNFSLWDTFRAANPLMSVIEPQLNEAYIRSLIAKGEEGGLVPKWDCGSNYTGCMIGYHYVSLVADAYTKGYRNYNVDLAYKHMLRSAEYDTTGITKACPKWLYPEIMPEARDWKNKLGYIPCDKNNESVAKALEYAYDDWCIAVLADALGDQANSEKYHHFAKAYKEYFDPAVGYMRGKDSQGRWHEPFDPTHSNHREDDYCEGNAYQWSWFAPHDVEGLVETYGGRENFLNKLDGLF
ncbi:MAG: glycoside hydrolase family 92 protein, partial [Bacteroidaceae bacterium]|nr:glycoside hydrolase family 92 protein [Bacteroidaceae bacterium]